MHAHSPPSSHVSDQLTLIRAGRRQIAEAGTMPRGGWLGWRDKSSNMTMTEIKAMTGGQKEERGGEAEEDGWGGVMALN